MDDKIFIREQEEPAEGGRSRVVMLAILALVLLALGAGYFMFVANKDDANTEDNTPTDSAPVTDDSDEEEDTDNEEPVEEETDEPEEEDTETDEPAEEEPVDVDEEDFKAPSDTSKLNLYFPKADGSFGPSLRDKPANATTYVLTEILRGPNSAEVAAGYTKTWAFSGSSQCGGSTFKYEVTGSTLKVTMCKDFSGSDIEKYIKALNFSITELNLVSKVAVVNVDGECMGADKSCI